MTGKANGQLIPLIEIRIKPFNSAIKRSVRIKKKLLVQVIALIVYESSNMNHRFAHISTTALRLKCKNRFIQ